MAGIAVRHHVQEVAYAAEDCGGLLSYDNLTLIYIWPRPSVTRTM